MATVIEEITTSALTIGVETTVTTTLSEDPSSSKFVVVALDAANLAGGTTPDILEVRLKTKVLAAGTLREAYPATYVGGQLGPPNKYSIPVPVIAGADTFRVTLKQTQGTGRVFTLVIYEV